MIFFLPLTVKGRLHRKAFKLKKYGGTGINSEKLETLSAELDQTAEAATSSYSETDNLLKTNLFRVCGYESSEDLIKVFSSLIFLHSNFFNGINHGCRAAILKKNSLWLLPFYMVETT